MADNGTSPDFRSIVNAATAEWHSRRITSPDHPQIKRNGSQRPSPDHIDEYERPATNGPATQSVMTAWEGALQALPDELRNIPIPIHPLAQALAQQPAIRSVEWNPYRQQGGFKPRTAVDYSSLMIYISGQVNPNPCRNCRLKNGPYLRCIVSPPSVLALSSLRQACANCSYQNQHRKCTNLPIDDEDLITRSRIARSSLKRNNPTPMKPPGRKPKAAGSITSLTKYRPDHGHMVRKPSAQSISAESFADKLRQLRSWDSVSRRRMKAEVMQWQAAIMTVEAESTRTNKNDMLEMQGTFDSSNLRASILPPSQTPPQLTSSFAAPHSAEGSLVGGYGEEDSQQMDEDEDENEESDYEGRTWVSMNGTGQASQPPL
ncbi:hypothetical protein F4677DRAFT_449265 [Hypoxylon crocopeplum]|nr:hypothetical protein F4677DRAFT_449265 [Hypoxylon crocopeplum]